ncbi:ZIP zinc transporter-domain-containing protein [Dunaliella salina]|uniref:ZIP zinc transporter-domain-containing protein n=1 Tax=Dunaliella salina TaxID=3046 RepID=A0ABQ7GA00_DUNSA|nr:ZIP zinc transporter-domain-containing protein [Dunaliella salina]|eukprot:KAF5831438.1 ZIP zinc transporter-domain-containing protein [Dunaliella salina]
MGENAGGEVEGRTNRLGLAFGVVIGAGFMTTVGATVIFFSRRANTALLAAMLGLSAGVILYVSFVGLYITESVHGFQDSGYEGSWPLRHATFCFFGGMLLMWLLEKLSSAIISLDKCWGSCGNKKKGGRMGGPRGDEREEGGIDHWEREGLGAEPRMASVLVSSTHDNPLSFPPFVLVEEEDDKPAFLGMRMPAPDPRYTRIQPSSSTNAPAPTSSQALDRASNQSCAPAGTSHHQGHSLMSDSPSPLSPPTPGHDGSASPLAATQQGGEQGGVVPPEGASAAVAVQHGGGSAAGFSGDGGGSAAAIQHGGGNSYAGCSGGGGAAAVHCGGGRSAAGCSGGGDGGGGGGSVTGRASQAGAESVQHHVSHPAPPLAPPAPPPPSPPPPSPSAFHVGTDKQQEQQQQQQEHQHQQQHPQNQQQQEHQHQQQHPQNHQQQQQQQQQQQHGHQYPQNQQQHQHRHQQQQLQQRQLQQPQESHLHQLDSSGQQAGWPHPKPRVLMPSLPDPSVSGGSHSSSSNSNSSSNGNSASRNEHEIKAANCEAAECRVANRSQDAQEIQEDNRPQGAQEILKGGVQGEEPAIGSRPLSSRPQPECEQQQQQQQQQLLEQQAWQARRVWQFRSSSLGRCGTAAAAARAQGGNLAASGEQWHTDRGPETYTESVQQVPCTASRPQSSRLGEESQQQQQRLEQQAWQARRAWQFRSSSLGRRGTATAAAAAGSHGQTPAPCVELWGGLGKRTTENGWREAGALGAGPSAGGAPRRLPNGRFACEEKESEGSGVSHPLPLQGWAAVSSVQGAPFSSVQLAPTPPPWWRQCSNRTHRSALSTTLTSEISCGDESREIEAELERSLEVGEGGLPFLSSTNSRPLSVTVDAPSPLPGPECFGQSKGARLDRQHALPRWRQHEKKRHSRGEEKRGGGGCGEGKGWKGKADGSVDLEDGVGERGWVGPLSKFNSSREPLGGWSEDGMEGMEGASQRGGGEESCCGRPPQWLGERLGGLMRWLVLCRRVPKNGTGEGEGTQGVAEPENSAWAPSGARGCVCKHKGQQHTCAQEGGSDEDGEAGSGKEDEHPGEQEGQSGGGGVNGRESGHQDGASKEEKRRLGRVGMLTGLAIAIHNFPEGMAAFLAVLGDPQAGISLAVAVAIHNVPEGMVIAFPIAISTGSKWRGWAYGAGAGMMEPIGALVAWGALGNRTDDRLVFGIIFGIVAGMMVAVCLTEVLPTAFNYDPEDKWVTKGIVLGLLIMAAGTIAF